MSPPSSKPFFFRSQNAAFAPSADKAIKGHLGPDAGLVTVPHFELPPVGEPFDDTEGRFPMLADLEQFLNLSDDKGTRYWFAQVLPPEHESGVRSEHLMVDIGSYGRLRLVRMFFTTSERYIGTLYV